MMAPLNQGHTAVELLPESKRMPARCLPVYLYAFPEGIFIIGGDAEHADLVGSQVVKIEGLPASAVLKRVEEHESVENPMRAVWSGMEALSNLQMLRGIGVIPKGHDEVRLTLRARDGKESEALVGYVGQASPRKLIPPPVVAAPMFLRDVPNKHWFQPMPDSDALFVQVNQMSNIRGGETLEQFGLKLRKQLLDTPCKNVIVDLRHNNGGTTSLYPELLRTLIRHTTTEGNRLYVIIGRGTYSATSNFITDLERLAKPVFVGEPSSGTGNQDGDESHVELPYSGVNAWLTSVWWQLGSPGDLRRSLIPDIPVQLTAKAYFEGKDPALEVILEDIKRPARPPIPDFP